MGTSYRFLSTVDEASIVLNWFRSLPEKPIECTVDASTRFYFRDFGPLTSDATKSPIVNVVSPTSKCGVLTTIGEVHFLATPLSAFPGFNRINQRFREWLKEHPCVYSHRPDFVHQWDYFLEGSARNWTIEIFALPAGMSALESGAYFVASCDNDVYLDRVCRTLELRGVGGIQRPRD